MHEIMHHHAVFANILSTVSLAICPVAMDVLHKIKVRLAISLMAPVTLVVKTGFGTVSVTNTAVVVVKLLVTEQQVIV